ncbi:MAG: ABC transporter permease [Anaerolineae bacterium]|nr:ABC transporter permease [Anaerolineae bacterium]
MQPQPSFDSADNLPTIYVKPIKGWTALNIADVWDYRELLVFLIWRDVKVRYRQTVLGGAWAIIQPFFTMVVFSIFFGQCAKMPSDGIPYPIFSYTALVPWSFFASSLQRTSGSLVSSANLLTKVYFPRLIIPLAAAAANLVDFVLAFVILLIMMLFYGIVPTINIIWLPVFMFLALITALGVGLWLAAINVQIRDVGSIVPFLVQFWLFATPIAYPSSLLPEPWHTVYGLNPMAGVVEGFRWALLGLNTPPGPMVLVSAVVALIVFIGGLFYFQRMETIFADVV